VAGTSATSLSRALSVALAPTANGICVVRVFDAL
jgi:hypothetical protein